jgi:bifunctional UDP-N-acetylglucosamine pyrophosphorylase/glucosamine-1-phosphate N-acetyltransferase
VSDRRLVAVVLAAGKGTRMRSKRPKVLHEAAGRPLLSWVLDAARAAGCEELVVVVGHGAEAVQAAVAAPDVRFVIQEDQRGTGHALAQAAAVVEGPATLLVLSGDVPLLRPGTLRRLQAAGAAGWGALAAAELEAPGSLGRVVADAVSKTKENQTLERIVEAVDASPDELALRRVNAGLYVLPAPEVFALLAALEPDNEKGEIYLTDALTAAAAAGERVTIVDLDDPAEAFGANDRGDLARIHRAFLDRKARDLAAAGVTIFDPASTTVEPGVDVGPDTVVHPGVKGRQRKIHFHDEAINEFKLNGLLFGSSNRSGQLRDNSSAITLRCI